MNNNSKYKVRVYNIWGPKMAKAEDEINKEFNDGWKVHSTDIVHISDANIMMVLLYDNMRNNILCDLLKTLNIL